MVKRRPNWLEETTNTKQGLGQYMEVGTVNGWRAGGGGGLGNWGDEISVNGGDGESLMSKHSPTFS